MVAGVLLRAGQPLGGLRVEIEHDAALVDAVDVRRVGEAVAAAGVDDHAVEDVRFGDREHVLDAADLLPVGAHHRHAFGQYEIRDGVAEIHRPGEPLP